MQKTVLSVAVILLSVVSFVRGEQNKLGTVLDVTYVSRYIDKGYDCYPENHSGIQSSIALDLYGSGFGVKITNFRANGGNFENCEKINYRVYYHNSFFEDQTYATNYNISWIYHNFPDQPRNAGDEQEIETAFSWPNILPGDLVLSYIAAASWPSESGAANHNNGGWAHIFGLSRDLTVPPFLPETTEQVLHLSAAVIYNDGVGPGCRGRGGASVDHDWSHALFGISTQFNIADNLTFTPGLYYQSSWDDSVNTQDEYWTSLSMTYKF